MKILNTVMMNMRSVIFIFFMLVSLSMYGQAPSPFYYTGYGRALIEKSRYDENSDFQKNDTVSAKRALSGNFVFDLGINIKPSDIFKFNTILRVSHQLGGFWGNGSSLDIRQVQIQGVIAKKINYSLGDIDVGLTKYTLYNNFEPTYSEFEAEAIKIKRSIAEYDNFNNGNNWRLQGAQASSILSVRKFFRNVIVSCFGTRIRPSDYFQSPDRILYGGNIKGKGKMGEIGFNTVGLGDIEGSVNDTVVFYKNRVYTGEYKLNYTMRNVKISVFGEAGMSLYDLNKVEAQKRFTATGDFFDVGAGVSHKVIPISLNVSYRRVDVEFFSNGAQSRRVLDDNNTTLLSEGGSGLTSRKQHLIDRVYDLSAYNRTISTTLMYFNPIYNNSTPYGIATPNRKGFTIDGSYGNRDSLLYVNLNTQILSEVIGVGVSTLRKFVVINPGVIFNVNKLLNLSKRISLSGAVRYEHTTGVKTAGIDLTSITIDAGASLEILKRFDVLGGMKYFSANGREVISSRDEFNQILNYNFLDVNIAQSIYTAGLRYRISNFINLAMNMYIINNENKSSSGENYKINQYFISYIMRF